MVSVRRVAGREWKWIWPTDTEVDQQLNPPHSLSLYAVLSLLSCSYVCCAGASPVLVTDVNVWPGSSPVCERERERERNDDISDRLALCVQSTRRKERKNFPLFQLFYCARERNILCFGLVVKRKCCWWWIKQWPPLSLVGGEKRRRPKQLIRFVWKKKRQQQSRLESQRAGRFY